MELFDNENDPGRGKNLLLEKTEVGERMKAEYRAWWGRIGEHSDTVSPIFIAGKQNPVMITCYAWHSEKGLYNHGTCAPAWSATTGGRSRVSLKRSTSSNFAAGHTKREYSDLCCCAATPQRSVRRRLRPGEILSIRSARIKASGVESTTPVAGNETCKTFRGPLKKARLLSPVRMPSYPIIHEES